MSARWVPAGDGTLSGTCEITLSPAEWARMHRPVEIEGPSLPWWLDEDRTIEPLFLPLTSLGTIDWPSRLPKTEGITYVHPGEPGYDDATERTIANSAGIVAWHDRGTGVIRAVGAARSADGTPRDVLGVLRHGYLTEPPTFSRSRSSWNGVDR